MKFECIKIEHTKSQHNIQFAQIENGQQVAALQFVTISIATVRQFVPGEFYEIDIKKIEPTKI